jgi:hypothetical protein
MKVKVIDLPKEGLTAQKIQEAVDRFVEEESPKEILQVNFDSNLALLIVVYR